MLGWRWRPRYGPIGLDIGADGLRMLQMGRQGGRLCVCAAARWHFPPGSGGPAGDSQARRRLARQAVADIRNQGAFRGREVVSCLRAEELSVKNIRLPHMPEAELDRAVPWECKERFGFQVSPDRVYYVNAGEVREGPEARDEILLIAVPEETVNRHLEMLGEMRLCPRHLDTEPTALFRTYQRFLRRAQDESAISVILDVGFGTTKVVVARGRTVLLIKTIDLGGRKFDESVARQLGLDPAEAGQLRKGKGGDGQPSPKGQAEARTEQVQLSIQDAIREGVEALAREVSLCLRYCAVTFRGLRPTRVTLAGGEVYDPTLVRLLQQSLDCPCVLGEPLRGVDLGRTGLTGNRRGELPEWSVATGLALRDLLEEVDGKVTHEAGRVPA